MYIEMTKAMTKINLDTIDIVQKGGAVHTTMGRAITTQATNYSHQQTHLLYRMQNSIVSCLFLLFFKLFLHFSAGFFTVFKRKQNKTQAQE